MGASTSNTSRACCVRTDSTPEDERNLTDFSKYRDSSTHGLLCMTYRMYPVCPPHIDKPWKCEFALCCWRFLLLLFLGGIIAAIVTQCVRYIEPCDYRCAGIGECYTNKDICDGDDFCPDRNDEQDCKPKIQRVPSTVTGLVGRDVSINCDVIMGDNSKVLEWYYTTQNGNDIQLWNSEKRKNYEDGFAVMNVASQRTCDLQLWSVQPAQIDEVFHVQFKKGSQHDQVNLIVAENFTCDFGTSGEEVSLGDVITLTASVSYYGVNEPEIAWYLDENLRDYSESIVQNGDVTTKTTTYSTSAFTTMSGLMVEALLLVDPDDTDYSTSNYAQKCETYYNVFHGANHVVIGYTDQQNDSNFNSILLGPGSILTCSASGYPLPGFTWTCNDGLYIIYGSDLEVPGGAPADLDCECVASNFISGDSNNLRFTTYNGSPRCLMDWKMVLLVFLLIAR